MQHRVPQPQAGRRLVLLTRAGCQLCEQARLTVAQVAAERAVDWAEVDVQEAGEDELLDTYGDRLPVLLLDGVEHGYWRIEPARLRAALDGQRIW